MKKIIWIVLLSFSCSNCANAQTDSIKIKKHLEDIINNSKPRNFSHIDNLNVSAEYIFNEFNKYGDSTHFQKYQVGNLEYKNVITSFGPKSSPRIIVGAHYDVCGNQDGADDNASGIAALLEFARLFQNQNLNYRIDLVAYTLEEPPYFGTKDMGSYKHAEYLFENKIDVYGMLCLDMIGYFKDEKNTQDYPLRFLKLFYGSKGNYITAVKKMNGGKFAKKSKRQLKKLDDKTLRVKSITAPAKIEGIAFSDHLNYWRFGYSALFITDTGFFRNPNYHLTTDTLETLDIQKICKVSDLIFKLLVGLN